MKPCHFPFLPFSSFFIHAAGRKRMVMDVMFFAVTFFGLLSPVVFMTG
jgi:hypothetical protein